MITRDVEAVESGSESRGSGIEINCLHMLSDYRK